MMHNFFSIAALRRFAFGVAKRQSLWFDSAHDSLCSDVCEEFLFLGKVTVLSLLHCKVMMCTRIECDVRGATAG